MVAFGLRLETAAVAGRQNSRPDLDAVVAAADQCQRSSVADQSLQSSDAAAVAQEALAVQTLRTVAVVVEVAVVQTLQTVVVVAAVEVAAVQMARNFVAALSETIQSRPEMRPVAVADFDSIR